MKRYLVFLLLAGWLDYALPSESQRIYLSGTSSSQTVDWDFFCTGGRESGHWTKIPVPSNWELQGFGTYNYGHDWKNPEKTVGDEKGLYKHKFNVPADWRGQTVMIVFEGSMTDTRVQINGNQAGPIYQGSFYRFSYDITHFLRYGQTNLLEVEVAKRSSNESVNKAEREADYWIFGGIYRPVYLEVHPRTHISQVSIDAKADGDFRTVVQLKEVTRDHSLVVELFDMKGNKTGNSFTREIPRRTSQIEISGVFDSIKTWSQEWPNLYTMKISLFSGSKNIHQVSERVGFRTVELRKHDGFYVNGEKVVFKGVNRHSFWPTTGRALNEENHLLDIRLIKEMNMNSVRMSHYPPDKRFLELCDSLGLFVLNEVAGWQDGYDTIVGPKVIQSTVTRDHNHPSVVMWQNGNEGGWDFRNEKWFYEFDIQKRPVLYPWLLRNGMDLHHYPSLNYGIAKYHNGNDPFIPTEFLHGLYDGGHGSGLEDYWNHYQTSPLHAGGILWVFTDEAVLRTDMEGIVLDSDRDHAPDGILGPNREKGGSFNTIREIWSPVQVEPVTINKQWNGRLYLSNRFIYTNLNQCSFRWEAVKTGFGNVPSRVIDSGEITAPDAIPGETVAVQVPANGMLQDADLFLFTASDPHGNDLYTWSWPVIQTWEKAEEIRNYLDKNILQEIKVKETKESITVKTGSLEISFSRKDGQILTMTTDGSDVGFSGGTIVGADMPILGTRWTKSPSGEFTLVAYTDFPARSITWKLEPSGMLMFEADLLNNLWGNYDYLGITFNYPEQQAKSIEWMGRGPYRVWKNRQKGANIGVWKKDYNNTITGESFNELVYPEFKGYHGNLFWAKLETTQNPITMISGTPNLFFRLFTPGKPKHVMGGTNPPFPEGDISFLLEIPAMGTKFKQPEWMGLRGQKGWAGGHPGEQTYPIRVWFDFSGKRMSEN